MPRPSLKAQRREQIIDAAMSCVAQHGIRGLTLDKVADIADIARPLIRHNVGNREQLVNAVTQEFVRSSNEQMNEMIRYLPEDQPLTIAIGYLFETQNNDTRLTLVAEALITESASDKAIANVMRQWLMGFVEHLEILAANEFPKADKETRLTVATGITSLYFTVDSVAQIGDLLDFTSSAKKAAFMLLEQL